jgi:hypothetical protein
MHFEAANQESLQVEALLAQLQTEGTPAGGMEDADNDTSNDENPIETMWINWTKWYQHLGFAIAQAI